ncbi:hypothetical protein [Pectobacterium brasiliense]|uniref:hypothetical protein n=1 Tax=Pectobacterium brasiliense TaxID=180957 RepID=UPI00057E742B|nr:hypothetical protein [Pectobacterium brasiliense]KHT43515.1 hypothetical protein RD02_01830 [Pectobacterium brasiliense]
MIAYFVYKVVAVGGWTQVVEMFNEFHSSKFGGVFCKYMAILDGDVKTDYDSSGRVCVGDLKFLPIKSLEKFVYEGIINNHDGGDYSLYDRIESCFFNSRDKTLDDVIKEYIKDNPNHTVKDKAGKNFQINNSLICSKATDTYEVVSHHRLFNIIYIMRTRRSERGN